MPRLWRVAGRAFADQEQGPVDTPGNPAASRSHLLLAQRPGDGQQNANPEREGPSFLLEDEDDEQVEDGRRTRPAEK